MKIQPKNITPRIGYKFYCTLNQYTYIVSEVNKDKIQFKYGENKDDCSNDSEWIMENFLILLRSSEMLRIL